MTALGKNISRLALLFVLYLESIFAVDYVAFESWKFSDYEDYDIVKWGTQRGLCPEPVGFCGEQLEIGETTPEPGSDECVARDKDVSTLLHNVLYKGVFCGVSCSEATDCAPDQSCCSVPCGIKMCVKSEAGIPIERRKCPALLQKCSNKNEFRCIRSDQFCNGVNDCGDNSDEDESTCQKQYAPVFKHGIQNVSSGLLGFTNLLLCLTTVALWVVS